VRILFLSLLMLLVTSVFGASTAHAQRYLTEFVGTARVAATASASITTAVDTNLQFDTSLGRRLEGSFSFTEFDSMGTVEVQSFTVDATLAASGSCPARLSTTGAKGTLHLQEYTFDTNSFALLGSLDLDDDPGTVDLTGGRVRGATAYLNPPVDAVKLASTGGEMAFVGDSLSDTLTLSLGEPDDTGAQRGTLEDRSGEVLFDVVVASGPTWFYVTGVGSDGYLVGRGKVGLNGDGAAETADGSWSIVTSESKVVDGGDFSLTLGD
jgi:hypothetical protein